KKSRLYDVRGEVFKASQLVTRQIFGVLPKRFDSLIKVLGIISWISTENCFPLMSYVPQKH
ncbi:MAG TPA: hypothetical protein VHH93_03030, partial [Gammaproteobacteria bacterium]|nr:hypothetical protein [Gammaproteobacteria bacterium]